MLRQFFLIRIEVWPMSKKKKKKKERKDEGSGEVNGIVFRDFYLLPHIIISTITRLNAKKRGKKISWHCSFKVQKQQKMKRHEGRERKGGEACGQSEDMHGKWKREGTLRIKCMRREQRSEGRHFMKRSGRGNVRRKEAEL